MMGMTVDWKAIRTEYEIMHSTVKELANSHHVGEAIIAHAIKSEEWVQRNGSELEVDDLSERLASMDIFHQRTLVPKFISLQAKMLDKCDILLDKVDSIEHATELKIVSEVIEKHRPNIMGVKKDTQQDNNLRISILNKVGDGPDVSVSAVEITQTAGLTNGLGACEQLN